MGQYTSGRLVYGMLVGEFSCPDEYDDEDEYLRAIVPDYDELFDGMHPGNGYGENYVIYWKASEGNYEDEFVPIERKVTDREDSEYMNYKMVQLKKLLDQKHKESLDTTDYGEGFGFVCDPMWGVVVSYG
jgi:hypothetical protein